MSGRKKDKRNFRNLSLILAAAQQTGVAITQLKNEDTATSPSVAAGKYLVKLLQIPPEKRMHDERESLSEAIAQYNFFRNMNADLRLQLCNFLGYAKCAENHVLFRQGDAGELFYVIISGTCRLTVFNGKQEITLGSLEAGDQFGERSLVNSVPRAATVTCVTKCEFATLTKDIYKRNMRNIAKDQLKSRVEFLSTTAIFQKTARPMLFRSSYFVESNTYNIGDVILAQGSVADRVYWIQEGQCKVVRRLTREESTTAQAIPAWKPQRPHKLELARISPPDSFGDYSLLTRKKMPYSVICCATPTVTLSCDMDDVSLCLTGKANNGKSNRKDTSMMLEMAENRELLYDCMFHQSLEVRTQMDVQGRWLSEMAEFMGDLEAEGECSLGKKLLRRSLSGGRGCSQA
ncbi:hypothetical protein CYMTET_38012 [Cymbomonas tetramitiformis]|uniref:Cyclic nucleotide-binding domain-containing protein n=1 Tax=Cymbomonas tetramitiformis TaxID=36881 RepID=A0AAE0CCT2_9CHLO|nr:hypothetical protein CYMTET_38012 [Cymbomonas tetramitiformis]